MSGPEKGNAAANFLSSFLSGQPAGTEASAQTDWNASNSHPHSGGKGDHHDAFHGKVEKDGSVSVGKMHSDD